MCHRVRTVGLRCRRLRPERGRGSSQSIGAGPRPRRGGHEGHADFGLQITLDVTEALTRLVERGALKDQISVTLVPMGVSPPNERFTFDARANPRIDAILLTIEKGE